MNVHTRIAFFAGELQMILRMAFRASLRSKWSLL